VFVHGGPGAYEVSDFERGKEWYQRLAQHGFDVYLYDQIGSGLSARLANPREYTLARHVADLEAIRNIIGGPAPLPSGVVDAGRSRQFVLIGGSFGATLVANYMATYPRRVTKAVFLCPGKLDPSEWTESHPANPQITSEFLEWIEKERGASGFRRYSELNTLMQSNLQAAYAMAPDSEMDPLLDEFVDSILPTTVYDKTLMKGKHSHGMGWWSYTMTNWDANRLQTHPRSVLAADHTPVLIMRGDADYVPEEVARQYEITFPNAKFMRVAKAGHYIWLDQPDVFKSAIESFLAVDSVNSK
jgi:proline iminopeptidase